jgi:chromosome partitioning protein
MEFAIANQHSATGKTTTTLGLARALAGLGKKVLIVDLDPKSGVTATLKLAPQAAFYDSLFRNVTFEDCVTPVRENLDVICSGSTTYVAEERLKRESSPQTVFEYAFSKIDDKYDTGE